MRRIFCYLSLLFILLACSKQQTEEERDYYVLRRDPNMAPPPAGFYGHHNFILLDSSIYYFRIKPMKGVICGTGMTFERPEVLHLKPSDLNQIKREELLDFLKVVYVDYPLPEDSIPREITYISSPSLTDTIRNQSIKVFRRFLPAKNVRFYMIRNSTEEELFVATAKSQNKEYHPDSVEWKIGVDSSYYYDLILDKAYFYNAKKQMRENSRSKIITF